MAWFARHRRKISKRYLDILMDPSVKDLLIKKIKFWDTVRNFMKEKGFLEVGTPTLEVTTGGAEATPLKHITKISSFHFICVFLWVNFWQKRLLASGFVKLLR